MTRVTRTLGGTTLLLALAAATSHALALSPAPLEVSGGAQTIADASETPTSGPITVNTAWMRQPPPGADVAGAYLTITNAGPQADRLVGGAAPFAGRFEVHEMKTENGMMRMQEVEDGLEIPAGETVELAPGSFHIMMMGLTRPPKAGEHVPLTLTFEKAGDMEVMAEVAPMGAMSAPGNHGGHGAN